MITGHRHPSVKPWWQLLAWAWRTWDMGRISRVYIKIPQASQQSIVYYILYILYKIQWHGCSIWNEGQPNRVILYPLATPAAVWNVFSTTWIHFRLWQRLVTIPHLLMSCLPMRILSAHADVLLCRRKISQRCFLAMKSSTQFFILESVWNRSYPSQPLVCYGTMDMACCSVLFGLLFDIKNHTSFLEWVLCIYFVYICILWIRN